MRSRLSLLSLVPLGLFLAGAGPAADALSLVRRGNAAFADQNYAKALEVYSAAEAATTDPGLVAFNKAAALYRLARLTANAKLLDEAARGFRACSAEAVEPRRSQALFNRGNCLLLAHSSDVRSLAEAMRCYAACLRHAPAGSALADDARHNLELAKIHWIDAVARRRDNPDEPPPDKEDTTPPNRPMGDDPDQTDDGLEPGGDNPRGFGKKEATQEQPGMQPRPTNATPPAGGDQAKPPRDGDRPRPLSAKDAAEQVRRAAQRVLDQSWQQRSGAYTPAEGVKDW